MKRDCSNPAATAWFQGLTENPERFPFRFTCGGTAYKGFGAPLVPAGSFMETEGEKTVCEKTFRVPGGLLLTLKAVHYADYGASEWTVWFENEGAQDSPVLTDISSELSYEGAYPTLKGILGVKTDQSVRDYAGGRVGTLDINKAMQIAALFESYGVTNPWGL